MGRAVLLAVLAAGALVVAAAPAFLLAPVAPPWAPSWLRHYAFDLRLALGPTAKSLASLRGGEIGDRRLHRAGETREIEISGSHGTLAATAYEPREPGERPGVLLLHGSTPRGRRLGLYRVLADALAGRGYVVLVPDQRGYGDSADPPRYDDARAFDYVGDAKRAVTALASLPSVDAGRLFVVGHSFGGDVALAIGLSDPRLRRIVAIGPVRRFGERMGRPGAPPPEAPLLAYQARREMRYLRLTAPIPGEVFLAYRFPLNLEGLLDLLLVPGHPPLLLIDGAREPEADRAWLADVCARLAEPTRCSTLPDADHYANVSDFGPVVVYDRRAVADLTDAIDAWLGQDGGAAATPAGKTLRPAMLSGTSRSRSETIVGATSTRRADPSGAE